MFKISFCQLCQIDLQCVCGESFGQTDGQLIEPGQMLEILAFLSRTLLRLINSGIWINGQADAIIKGYHIGRH